MTGLDFSWELKKLSPQTNIVFVTGHTEYAVDAFRVGASDYLMKPPTPKSVMQALEMLRNPVKMFLQTGYAYSASEISKCFVMENRLHSSG